jgi:hypothetical protein
MTQILEAVEYLKEGLRAETLLMECLNADQEMFSYQNLFRKERFCDKLAHL